MASGLVEIVQGLVYPKHVSVSICECSGVHNGALMVCVICHQPAANGDN